MSASQVRQLHSDLEKLSQKTPGQFVEEATLTIFNAILVSAKAKSPDNVGLQAVPEAKGSVRYSDMVIRVGILKEALESEEPISFGVI
jgi:hypothetical protein